MLLAAGGLLAATSTYPNAQRVSDEGMQVFGSCPTYGAQVGSVRSPLCSWSISRQDWYESEDAMPEVYRWYQARERTWTISMGRFHAWLAIDRVQPAAPVNGLARFGVGRGLWIWLGQR